MTLLTFNSKYIVQSSTSKTTTSTTFVDDTYATRTFDLSGTKTVLVIYNANSQYGDVNTHRGFRNTINIDGTDHITISSSPCDDNHAIRNTCFAVVTLDSGSHTITGRISSPNGSTVTVSNRTLLIYILDGSDYTFTENTTANSTNTNVYVDDIATTFTPSGDCKALILYGASKDDGVTEYVSGKKIRINLNDSAVGVEASQAPCSSTCGNALITAYACQLSASETVIKGQFASNVVDTTVSISRSALAILLFDPSVTLQTSTSTSQISTTSTTLINDSAISTSNSGSSEVLAIAVATKNSGYSSSYYGFEYGLAIDSSDVALSRVSPSGSWEGANTLVAYAATLTSGSHVINGKYALNSSTTATTIDQRILLSLWFNQSNVPLQSSISGTGSIEEAITCSTYYINSTTNIGSGNYTVKSDVLADIESKANTGSGVITKATAYITSYIDNVDSEDNAGSGEIDEATIYVKWYVSNKDYTGSGSIYSANATYLVYISTDYDEYSSIGSSSAKITFAIKSSLTGSGSHTVNCNVLDIVLPLDSELSGTGYYSVSINSDRYIVISSFTKNNNGSYSATLKSIYSLYVDLDGSGDHTVTSNILDYVSYLISSSDPTGAIGSSSAQLDKLLNIYYSRSGLGNILWANLGAIDYITASGLSSGKIINSSLTVTWYITSLDNTGSGNSSAVIQIEPIKISSLDNSGIGTSQTKAIVKSYISVSIKGTSSSYANIGILDSLNTYIKGTGVAEFGINEICYVKSQILSYGKAIIQLSVLSPIFVNNTGSGQTNCTLSVLVFIDSEIGSFGDSSATTNMSLFIDSELTGIGDCSVRPRKIITGSMDSYLGFDNDSVGVIESANLTITFFMYSNLTGSSGDYEVKPELLNGIKSHIFGRGNHTIVITIPTIYNRNLRFLPIGFATQNFPSEMFWYRIYDNVLIMIEEINISVDVPEYEIIMEYKEYEVE
jgi:hypothetical protein